MVQSETLCFATIIVAPADYETSSPTQSSALMTSVSNNSESRPTTGETLNFGSGSPFGRPMCVATTTDAPCSFRKFIVGTTALNRVSSVMVTPSSLESGTFRSNLIKTRDWERSTCVASMRFCA